MNHPSCDAHVSHRPRRFGLSVGLAVLLFASILIAASGPAPATADTNAAATAVSATVGPSFTPTPGTAADAVCGDGYVEGGEQCDDGGTCIGGADAGAHCTRESDCQGNGVCTGGTKVGTACASDADCPNAICQHCVPQGGDGCAANCTLEHDVVFDLAPSGLPNPGFTVSSNALTVPLPLSGMQTLTIGEELNGQIPAVIKSTSVQIPAIDVLGGSACACVRGVALKTCGGTVFEPDGSASPDCTLDDSVCAGKNPCAYAYGPGNAAAGMIGCDGLTGTDVSYTQNAGGSGGTAASPIVTFSGSGGPGAALFADTLALSTVIGACSGMTSDYGPDGQFCTADDPPSARGTPLTLPLTTGIATAEVFNANGQDGVDIGPVSANGSPFNCAALEYGDDSGAGLATAFTELAVPIVGDIAITGVLGSQSGAPPLCCLPTAGSISCVLVPCTPTPAGSPTPTPTPEGACYFGASDCGSQSFQLTSQQACCLRAQLGALPLALSWCPAGAFDPTTGACDACTAPCTGLPTPTPTPTIPPCCDPRLGIPCMAGVICPPPTIIPPTPPPTISGCDLACDDRPCLGYCPDGRIEEGTCSSLTIDTGCRCVPDCGPELTPTPAPGTCGPVCDPTQACVVQAPFPGVTAAKGLCTGQSPNGCICEPIASGTPVTGTPIPTPAGAAVEVGSASGLPGSTAIVDVTLHSADLAVAGIQNDIIFDPSTPIVQCTGNPAINKKLTGFSITGTRLRAIVAGLNVDPIPDGAVLYSCTVEILSNAAPGKYPLQVVNVIASDPLGNALPASGLSGAVVVLGAALATPTGTLAATPLPSHTPLLAGSPLATPSAVPTVEGGQPGVLQDGGAAGASSGGGCAVVPSAHGSAMSIVLFGVPLLLLWRRRQRRACLLARRLLERDWRRS